MQKGHMKFSQIWIDRFGMVRMDKTIRFDLSLFAPYQTISAWIKPQLQFEHLQTTTRQMKLKQTWYFKFMNYN